MIDAKYCVPTNITKKDFNFFWNNCNQIIKGFNPNDTYSIFNNTIITKNNFSSLKFDLNTNLPFSFKFKANEFFQNFKTSKKNFEEGILLPDGFKFKIEGKEYFYESDEKMYIEEREFWCSKIENFFKEEDNSFKINAIFTEENIEDMNKMKSFVIRVDNNGEISLDYSFGKTKNFAFQCRFDKNILLDLDKNNENKIKIVKSKKRSFSEFWFNVTNKNYSFIQVFKTINV